MKIYPMKLSILFVLFSSLCLGQSKKEQIINLNKSIDSLATIVIYERQVSTQKNNDFLTEVKKLSDRLVQKQQDSKSFQDTITALSKKMLRCSRENDKFKKKLKDISQKNLEMEAELKILKDSEKIVISENDFTLIENNIVLVQKDVSVLNLWLKKIVIEPMSSLEKRFTKSCYAYVQDATEFYWGNPGSIDEFELKDKWKNFFDLDYSSFGHVFENGNCGWETKTVNSIDYFGDLNGGSWFEMSIVGGCNAGEVSESIIRIVKIINVENDFKIANFLSVKD